MRRLIVILAMAVLGFAGWTAAFNRDSALYWQARVALMKLQGRDPGLVTRQTDPRGRTEAAPAVAAKVGVFIAYGQSNSANFGAPGHAVRHPVFNFLDGTTYAYEDPALGADGFGGSVWGRVGDGLVEAGAFDAVVFATTGFGSRTVAELGEGELYDYFLKQYQGLAEIYGHVDGILFHQGEQNHHDRSSADYAAGFAHLIARLRADGIDAPFYLSQASYCGNSVDLHLLAVQDVLISGTEGVLRGPNSDILADARYRRDGCHFSAEGLDAFAAQWVAAISAASED
ncbi:MAG: sialate O-acetylesterase [Oricola sp.]